MPENRGEGLRARRLWRRESALGVIEKIVFRAEAGADVPAYWCVPHGARKPYMTFICLQGHTTGMHQSIGVEAADERTAIEVVGDRDFAIGCMKRGMAALCVEQRSFGMRAQPKRTDPNDLCHEATMRAILLGRTLAGERVFDVDRAIDYLEQRGDVDMSRLGVMGNSTGGRTSMYAAALLPRIKLAMPSCCTARLRDGAASIDQQGWHHCSCNTVPDLLQWVDLGDVYGACAPKPVVLVVGRKDPLAPVASARAVYREARRVYAACGAADRIRLVEGAEGHRFYADLGWAAMMPLRDQL
jgi:dienelactone hydrolase